MSTGRKILLIIVGLFFILVVRVVAAVERQETRSLVDLHRRDEAQDLGERRNIADTGL